MILLGDCRDVLPTLPENSVHCVVTSPPYFGLRSYLPADHPDKAREIGQERLHDCLGWATGTPCGACFVCTMVDVMRHVRRVLRPDGVLWLNLGDSYAGTGKSGGGKDGERWAECGAETEGPRGGKWKPAPAGLKQKDLMGIPFRVALALQADGWWWRDTVIWRKPNPMPSSVNDRCTPAWEPVLMLSKSARYYFDWESIATPLSDASVERLGQDVEGQEGSHRANAGGKTNGTMKAVGSGPRFGGNKYGDREEARTKSGAEWTGRSKRDSFKRSVAEADRPRQNASQHREDRAESTYDLSLARRRNVWDIPTQGYKEAHFATFPERLPELCILASCPPGGVVLDPFLGSGTVGQVAQRLGRQWIGCELNDAYIPLAKARAEDEQPGLPLSHTA